MTTSKITINNFLFVFNFTFMLVFFYFAFSKNINWLFLYFDGSCMLDMIRQQARWGISNYFGFTNNLFQSIGNVFFPVNTTIIPAFAIATLFDDEFINKVIPYMVIATEGFLAICIFCANFKFKPFCGVIASWVFLLFAFPVVGPTLCHYEIFALGPHLLTCLAESLILLVLFSKFYKARGLRYITYVGLSITIITHMLLAYPNHVMTVVPFLAISAVSIVFAVANKQEAKRYIFTMIAITAFFLLSGFAHYYLGLFNYSAARFFPQELLISRTNWYSVSILFQFSAAYSGHIMFSLAVLGAGWEALYGNGLIKYFARSFLLYVNLLLLLGIVFIYIYPSWQGPVPLYFEITIWPLYAIFAVQFILKIMSLLISKLENIFKYKIKHSLVLVLGLLLPVCISLVYSVAIVKKGKLINIVAYEYPPKTTSIVEVLRDSIGFSNNPTFRGRVATFTGQNLPKASWYDLYVLDCTKVYQFGNDHRVNGFTYYDIPIFFEHNYLITPAFYKLTKEFLSLPQDNQLRNFMTLRKPNDKILKLLGVRYFVADAPIATQAKLILHDQVSKDYLYELDNVNVGQYSPVQLVMLQDANKTLEALASSDFDPQKSAVIHKRIDKELVTASQASMQFLHGNYVKVTAKSTGDSLLVLPLEFSNCLELHSAKSSDVKLFRVNLLQTGVMFNGDLDIKLKYYTGPLHNAQCRLKDKADVKKLGL